MELKGKIRGFFVVEGVTINGTVKIAVQGGRQVELSAPPEEILEMVRIYGVDKEVTVSFGGCKDAINL